MKFFKQCIIIPALVFMTAAVHAQEVDITKGNITFLKDEKSINLEFVYDKMSVGDFGKEKDYIKKRVEEANAKDGSGDIWARRWEDDKQNMFPEKFKKGFTDETGMTIDKNAKYTLIFSTTALEPGYQIGISKRNAGVDGQVWIVETANKEKKLAVLMVERAPETKWRGAAYDASNRIGDAYFLDGKKVGIFIRKNMKE
ncbi:MAG: hypothetical protein U0X40_00090 [Ferruginibacter sp.]